MGDGPGPGRAVRPERPVQRLDPLRRLCPDSRTPADGRGWWGLERGDILAAASGDQIAVITPDSVTLYSAEGAGNPILMDSFGNSGFGVGSNGMVYEFRFEDDDLLVERDVEHLRGPDGVKYRFGAADLQTLWLRLPDVDTTIDLIPVPNDGSETEVALGESVRDRQGRTHVILYGTSLGSPEIGQRVQHGAGTRGNRARAREVMGQDRRLPRLGRGPRCPRLEEAHRDSRRHLRTGALRAADTRTGDDAVSVTSVTWWMVC